MNHTLRVLRLFFLLLCLVGAWLISYTVPEWDSYRSLAVFIGVPSAYWLSSST
jgi:hypothetical protein